MPGADPDGVTAPVGSDGLLFPHWFAAVTVNMYGTLYVSPVIVMGAALLPERVTEMPAGVTEFTVYDVIGLPPLDFGAVKFTVTLPFPLTAVPMTGASGTVEGVTAGLVEADAGPFPSEFVAVTLNV